MATNKRNLVAIRDAMDAAVRGGAGDRWDHPAAARARRLTASEGMSWDFSSWADALEAVRDVLDESGLHRLFGVWYDDAVQHEVEA